MDTKTNKRLARAKAVAKYLGMAESTYWRLVAERDDFPARIRITSHLTLWDLNEIDAWLEAQREVAA